MEPTKALTREEIEELWGGALPELEPEYLRLAEAFPQGRPELAPYVMKKLFTLQEARAACALPGTAEQVAETLGISADEAEEMLMGLAVRGKILKTQTGYDAIRVNAFLRDYVFAQARFDEENGQTLARLILAWDSYVPERSNPDGTFRIIPKWRAVKTLPGVMPCENMPQMLLDCWPDEVAFTRCPCRALTSVAQTGEYHPEMFRGETGETADPKDGLCIIVGPRAKYFASMYGAYVPTREELLAKIEHIENNGTYYTTNNSRLMRVMCNCGDDCTCGMRMAYDAGREGCFAKSRFTAYLAKPDACVGCGTCERACMFHTSVRKGADQCGCLPRLRGVHGEVSDGSAEDEAGAAGGAYSAGVGTPGRPRE